MRKLTATVVAALGVACSAPVTQQGVRCGATTCSPGQVCCIDCDGTGSCFAPGGGCPGAACRPDAGSSAPDAGSACGTITCQPGQVCCIDCNGAGSCGPPGSVCIGAACQCGGTGQLCCRAPTQRCGGGLTCCEGEPYPEDGQCQAQCTLRSDHRLKEAFAPVDRAAMLEKLKTLPVSAWSYRAEGPAVRHVGPMAQDFHAVFGLGDDPTRIPVVDAMGVMTSSLQALAADVDALKAETRALREENARLQAALRSR